MVMPYIESVRVFREDDGTGYLQLVARVIVERHETIAHDDKFPHFEGKQYRSLGTMQLIDGEDWKPNQRGVDVRAVEVGVFPIEPDGTSFIKFRFSGSLLGLGDWIEGEQVIARGGRKKKRKR
jgi:hypothetical protein